MTTTPIRQSEFAAKHGLKPPAVAKLRRDHLEEGKHFWSEGRTIYWTDEAVAMIEEKLRPLTPEERAQQGIAMRSGISNFTRAEGVDRAPATIVHNEDGSRTIELLPAPVLNDIKDEDDAFLIADSKMREIYKATLPETVKAYVLKPCRNKRFVYASLNNERITVSVHPRQQQRIQKKTINVLVEKDGDTLRYTHLP